VEIKEETKKKAGKKNIKMLSVNQVGKMSPTK